MRDIEVARKVVGVSWRAKKGGRFKIELNVGTWLRHHSGVTTEAVRPQSTAWMHGREERAGGGVGRDGINQRGRSLLRHDASSRIYEKEARKKKPICGSL